MYTGHNRLGPFCCEQGTCVSEGGDEGARLDRGELLWLTHGAQGVDNVKGGLEAKKSESRNLRCPPVQARGVARKGAFAQRTQNVTVRPSSATSTSPWAPVTSRPASNTRWYSKRRS